MKKIYVSASTNPPKENELLDYVRKIDGIVDFIHCDHMDGKFVLATCLPCSLVKQINSVSTAKLDVHLMCEKPQKVVKNFAKAGANIITVHYEAFDNKFQLVQCLKQIKKLGCLVGIAIKPQTPVSKIVDVLSLINLVLIMSVEPGKSGQTFMFEVLHKIKTLSQLRFKHSYKYFIEVDGGINNKISTTLINNGADILVSGKYLFKAQDYKQAIFGLKY